MPVKTVSDFRGSGHFLSGENDPNLSNEAIVLAPIPVATFPDGLPPGTVVAKITAVGATQGQYYPHDPAAVDGTEAVNALVLTYHHAAPSAAAQKNVAVARHQVVNGNLVTWAVAVDAAEKAAAEAGFAVNQVMFRY